MPGFFGAVGVPHASANELTRHFTACWPDAKVSAFEGGVLGAHSFGGKPCLVDTTFSRVVAVDGELQLYDELFRQQADGTLSEFPAESTLLSLDCQSAGNRALLNRAALELQLVSDPSGTFPLYYTKIGEGLAFSSLLRPLMLLGGRPLDPYAVLQFVRTATVVGASTLFADVHRMPPGYALQFRRGGAVKLASVTECWIRSDGSEKKATEDAVWEALKRSSRRDLAMGSQVLMMSGGWDSRTLLAAAALPSSSLSCYSHGDVDSRELALVTQLCEMADVPCMLESIDDRIFAPQLLIPGLAQTESLSFPHWHRAGALLAQAGAQSASAGIIGEVLGGHYGPAMLGGTAARTFALISQLGGASPRSLTAQKVLHRTGAAAIPWYLSRDFAASVRDEDAHYNAAVDAELSRHRARGVTDETALTEAFITEHRGAQYIGAQLRSCRSHLDVSVPFAGPEAFVLSTQMPMTARVHNRLNRALLRRHAPQYTRLPLAATLVNAGRPILLQEASRAVRKLQERLYKARMLRTNVQDESGRLGWVNFGFLKGSTALRDVMSSLSSDLWNRDAINAALDRLDQRPPGENAHPLFDQLMKVKTVDALISK